MNKQETIDMVTRLMQDAGLTAISRSITAFAVAATIVPERYLSVKVYDYCSGGFSYRKLDYVHRIVIRTDEVGHRPDRIHARTFTTNRDRTFNEVSILKVLRELAQKMRDDAVQKMARAKDKANQDFAKRMLCDELVDVGVDMNPAGCYDYLKGKADTRFGEVEVAVTGVETIRVRLPEFETAKQVAAFLELIR